ncbi:hypothetical protein MRB53_041918 [Persea americana]|nr:hypothetical protein MRB53_041918 [Persea americana]
MPAKTNSTFEYSFWPPYQSNYTGAVIGMGSHLHDGGTHLDITLNATNICESVPTYGGNSGYIDAPGAMMSMDGDSFGMPPMKHISSITSCYAPNTNMINIGDAISVNAYYNFTEHAGMLDEDGSYMDVSQVVELMINEADDHQIMGISVLYMAENMTWNTLTTYAGHAVRPQAIIDTRLIICAGCRGSCIY